MTIDNTLSWKQHIVKLKQGCSSKINFPKKLSHTKYSSDRSTLTSLYRALIRSSLDYESLIYEFSNTSILDSLNTIQNSSSKLHLGAFCTTPTPSLFCKAFEPPLNIRRQVIATSILNILSTPNFQSKSKFIFPLNQLTSNISAFTQSITDEDILISPHSINTVPLRLDITY